MTDISDRELLREYVQQGSEEVFAELARRHVNLVYSTALRHVGIAAHAEEIAQAVFVILARKACGLRPDTVLEAWLYETTRLTSLSFLRGERRRQLREQEAYMQSTFQESGDDSTWKQIAPLLDEAMARLGKKDREALVLRFFKDNNLREVAVTMNVTEAAAQSRVHRALEKLRGYFSKQGVHSTTAIIAGEISAHSVHAAPAGLGEAMIVATKSAGISATLTTLVKGTMKTMTWLKVKFAVGVAVSVVLAAGVTTVAVSQIDRGTDDQSQLTSAEIVKKSQEAYAALTSYSDEGTSVGVMGDTVAPRHSFTIKLGRPDLYRIAWQQGMGSTGMVWSAGSGNFMKLYHFSTPQKATMQRTLMTATGVSGGATGSVPSSFFNLNWSSRLSPIMFSATRKPDEKVGGVDCFVLTKSIPGTAQTVAGTVQTIWIGKNDFLIRQVQEQVSAAALKASLEQQAEKHPDPELQKAISSITGDIISTETHENIVINERYSPSDFEP